MTDAEFGQTGEVFEATLAERVAAIVDNAASQVKQSVMSEVDALGNNFPQLEVAAKIKKEDDPEGYAEKMGAIILGHAFYTTTSTPAVIVEKSTATYLGDRTLLLTPEGLRLAEYIKVQPNKPGEIKYALDIEYEGLVSKELDNVLWLQYGSKAAKILAELKKRQTSAD